MDPRGDPAVGGGLLDSTEELVDLCRRVLTDGHGSPTRDMQIPAPHAHLLPTCAVLMITHGRIAGLAGATPDELEPLDLDKTLGLLTRVTACAGLKPAPATTPLTTGGMAWEVAQTGVGSGTERQHRGRWPTRPRRG